MSATINSANMSLPIPVTGVEPGPDYANDVNASLTIIDGHNHAAGSGVPINPSGININADLTFAGNNATTLRTVRFSPQGAALSLPTDLGCLYEVGVDLYYNDGSGNNVRITQGGGVAGSPGSIAGLASPASASYVSANQTFVWQSDVNTPANMDGASVILRNLSASSFGLTLNPPAAMGSNFSLTLPSIPGVTNLMTLDNSGNMGASTNVDNSTIEISSNTIQVKALGIGTAQLAASAVTTAKIADGNVTRAKIEALGQQLSASCGNYTMTSATPADVTNLSVTITTTGRPVFLQLISDGVGPSSAEVSITGNNGFLNFLRGSTVVGSYHVGTAIVPSSAFMYVDIPAAGTYTYKIQVALASGTGTFFFFTSKLLAYEAF